MNATDRKFPILGRVPYPLSFATLSGSHLYGFPSKDSDFDIRGMHVAPADAMLGLSPVRETFETHDHVDGRVDCEIVTHDAKKYFHLLLKNNGYVLEQVFSPLVIVEGILPELRPIARKCITRNHYKHYCGFSQNQWAKFNSGHNKYVKRILYTFRVMLTGIYLMRTGEVEANLSHLNDVFRLPYIPDLIAQKLAGQETGQLAAGHSVEFYLREYSRLEATLMEESQNSKLPDEPSGFDELNDLLLRLRYETCAPWATA